MTNFRKSLFVAVAVAACTRSASVGSPSVATGPEAPVAPMLSIQAPTPDPRVGLKGGFRDAGEAIWNLRMVSTTPPSAKFTSPNGPGDQRFWQSDLGFNRNYVAQGNFSGFQIWNIADPAHPTLASSYVCPGSQVDVSFYHNLLFLSHESTQARVDCGLDPINETASKLRARGIRVYDVSDMANPKMLTIVQTCRGSHTHTVVEDPKDKNNVYIYVSGSAGVRPDAELAGCSGAAPDSNPNTALFRIEVIQVPLAHPEQAHIVNSPRIFEGLGPAPKNATRDTIGRGGRGGAGGGRGLGANGRATDVGRPQQPVVQRGPNQCHDITVYPWAGLAGGACGGYGLLLDISDVKAPKRIGAAADSNFAFWHSATFNNDASKVLFTDEWGGGTQPRCRTTDHYEWGADAIFTIDARKQMHFQSYYKMPAAQTPMENCVAHNGSLVPVPGRDIMIQGWYQGGISMFDWTDAAHPKEIAFFDRGPIDTVLAVAGSWSAYWYNGLIYSSEIGRGLDIFEVLPSAALTQNEIDAAKTVHLEYLNVQGQPHITWPASFAKVRAFVDQLERTNGFPRDTLPQLRSTITAAEGLQGAERSKVLTALEAALEAKVPMSPDKGKLRMLIAAVRELNR